MTGQAAPGRLPSLDIIRGVAVMGILLLNIVAFGMPEQAYYNPLAYGGEGVADRAAWAINFVLFDGKMRGLFSFLFGASMLLVIDRAEAKGDSPALVHYSRMVWLLVFGLLHLWFVWWGDILSLYAPIGMIAYLARGQEAKTLALWGAMLVVAQCLLFGLVALNAWQAAAGLHAADPKAAARAAAGFAMYDKGFGIPSPPALARDLALFRGGYAGIVLARLRDHGADVFNTLFLVGPETLGYMFLGMAGLRSGLLTGGWPRARYRRWLAVSFGIAVPAYAAILAWMLARDLDTLALVTGVIALSAPVRPLMVIGWACLIQLLARPGGALTRRIAAAGRMAFTNYLVTSLVCTTLFYGYGLGWYGHLSRAQLYLVVAAMCAAMLLWSGPWLDRFRFGPFEWLWRSLARARLQPLRGSAAANDMQ